MKKYNTLREQFSEMFQKLVSETNIIQKWFFIIGVFSFFFWLLLPLDYKDIEDLLSDIEEWFDMWFQVFTFVLIWVSLLGFFLFKDKE